MTARNIINITIISYIFGIINCLNEGSRCYTDSFIGICTKLSECQSMTIVVKNGKIKFLKSITCSYVRDTPIVCCLDNSQLKETYKHHSGHHGELIFPDYITIHFPTTEKPQEKIVDKRIGSYNVRKSDKACQLYRSLRVDKVFFHITEGLPVGEGEFPHMVALGYPTGSYLSWECGGSLISERYVLTAAHCANGNNPTKVRIGKLSLDSNLDNLTPVDVSIDNIILHPQYTSFLKYNDIALIRLATDVEFVPGRILPACLNSKLSDFDSNTKLWATGWGVDSLQTRSRSPVLLKAALTSYGLMTCNKSHIDYGVTYQYPTGLDNGQLCAGDPTGRKDTCQADSGGPLQYLEIYKDMPVIIGVTSFNFACGSTIPSVFTRVAYYLEWIESIVWP